MNSVFLIDGCRSPIGRGHVEKGMYRDIRADELCVQVLQALIDRTQLDPKQIDDFYLGCVGQHLEQGKNLARLIILLAKLPKTIPGVTVNRLCSSSLTALQMAADSIRSDTNQQMLVGGIEHMGHVSITAALDYHPDLFNNYDFQWTNMGLTAEKLSEDFEIFKEDQDRFTMDSNQRYFDARETGFFDREIVPVTVADGQTTDEDQEPRLSTLESLAGLQTVFKEDGTITAANSSGISDGACMAWVGNESAVKQYGREPLAEIELTVNVGLDPGSMGLGPVFAIWKLLDKTGLSMEDIDLFEINEAFAVQVLACQKELNIDSKKLNIHGGAVALGHPLGMSGLRLAVTLAYSMAAENVSLGIASLCVGHGQGVAMLLKRNFT